MLAHCGGGGGIVVPAAVFCLFWRVLKSPKEYKLCFKKVYRVFQV